MPKTPDRGNQRPESQDKRKRQQLNDKALQGDEDNGNFANDREKASEAGRKGGQR